jgi:predicted MFS family arabinose efflux permease
MRPLASVAGAAEAGVLRSMREGFAYVWREPVIAPLFIVLVVVSVLARPLPQLLPAVAENHLNVGPLELSWLLAAGGIGALGGSIASASLGAFRRRGLLALAFAFATGLFLVALAAQSLLLPSIVLVGVLSFVTQAHVTNHVTVYQSRTPAHLRGRVVATSSTLAQSSIALGTLLIGAVGTAIGIGSALLIAGAVIALASIAVGWLFPRLRELGSIGAPLTDAQAVAADAPTLPS